MPPAAGLRDAASGSGQPRAVGQAIQLGTTLVVAVAVFTLLGYYVDRKRGGGHLWIICGLVLGLAYDAYEVWKVVRRLNDPEEEASAEADQADTRKPPSPLNPNGL